MTQRGDVPVASRVARKDFSELIAELDFQSSVPSSQLKDRTESVHSFSTLISCLVN